MAMMFVLAGGVSLHLWVFPLVSVHPGSRALRERGGHVCHAARQEADDHHRPAGAPARVSGEKNTHSHIFTKSGEVTLN